MWQWGRCGLVCQQQCSAELWVSLSQRNRSPYSSQIVNQCNNISCSTNLTCICVLKYMYLANNHIPLEALAILLCNENFILATALASFSFLLSFSIFFCFLFPFSPCLSPFLIFLCLSWYFHSFAFTKR